MADIGTDEVFEPTQSRRDKKATERTLDLLNRERKVRLANLEARCKELKITFGPEAIQQARVDTLIDTLIGSLELDEDGNATCGVERARFEVNVIDRIAASMEQASEVYAEMRARESGLVVPTGLKSTVDPLRSTPGMR